MNNNINYKLDPNWITGFVDAEGCFHVGLEKSRSHNTGWSIRPCFIIKLHIRDENLLLQIKSFFGDIGNIHTFNKSVLYRVQDYKSIISAIIPHFNNYPLITEKQNDFLIFKNILEIMSKKEHLRHEGLIQILSLKASLNQGLSDSLKELFPEISPINRFQNLPLTSINPYWFAGFFSGEGCFFVDIHKNDKHKFGYAVVMRISVGQNSRDKILMANIINLFGSGYLIEYKKENMVEFRISHFKDIYLKVIPFFNRYQIYGVKLLDYYDFKLIAELVYRKAHLSQEGWNKIKNIKSQMNRGRY